MGPCSSSSKGKQASPMLDKKTKEMPSSQENPPTLISTSKQKLDDRKNIEHKQQNPNAPEIQQSKGERTPNSESESDEGDNGRTIPKKKPPQKQTQME